MLIHGKERKFMLTVGASQDVAKLCPDNDLKRMGELMQGDYVSITDNIMQLIVTLNSAYEAAQAYETPGYTPAPLTLEQLRTLTPAQLKALEKEALAAFVADSTPTVEIEPDKDAKKNITTETP